MRTALAGPVLCVLSLPLLGALACGGELSGGEIAGVDTAGQYRPSSFPPGSRVSVCTPAGLGLNLRSAPGQQSAVLAVLRSGTEATVLASSGAWYRLQAERTGWAHGSYLCPGSSGPSSGSSGPSSSGLSGSGGSSGSSGSSGGGQAGKSFVRFVEPATGSSVKNGVLFRVDASADVARVRYVCDGYLIGTSTGASKGFAIQYSFSVLGKRTVSARALNAAGAQLSSTSVTITITSAGGGGICTGGFSNPAPGYPVTDVFGSCRDGCSRRHAGIDLGTPTGTLVRAADGGVVDYASWAPGYGYLVDVIHCGKYTTRYAHLSQFLVKPGQVVARGEPVARSGNSGVGTGPHLHFEIRIGGPYGTPVNPQHYISF